MTLVLKQLVRTNIYGTEIWATDKTGAYNAATNLGGFGAPNPTLARSALLSLIQRSMPDGEAWLTALTPQIVHNPLAVDTDVNDFGFTYINDGHHIAHLLRLRVSDDGGINDLDGVVINEEDYFTIGAVLYQKVGGINVEVPLADYPLLIEVAAITKTVCENMFYNKLWIKARDFYKEGMDFRNANCKEEADEAFAKHDELKRDIAGADYTFRSGLKLQAESIVKNLLDKYEIK